VASGVVFVACGFFSKNIPFYRISKKKNFMAAPGISAAPGDVFFSGRKFLHKFYFFRFCDQIHNLLAVFGRHSSQGTGEAAGYGPQPVILVLLPSVRPSSFSSRRFF
jgi:hypothetical protein